MGLPLRNPTSFTSLTSGAAPSGGPSITSDSDSDLDPSEPLSHLTQALLRPYPLERSSLSRRPKSNQARKLHRDRVRQTYHQQAYAHPATAETHHVKPRNPWAADADEGRALARSSLRLPGDAESSQEQASSQGSSQTSSSQGDGDRSRRPLRRSRSSSRSSSTRPPSLERQDAFRDDKTAKRRRSLVWDDDVDVVEMGLWFGRSAWASEGGETRGGRLAARREQDEQAEVAELYRMGLLYDDEYERGEGFSLDRIVREEPAYSLRVRPANPHLRRGRRDWRADYQHVSLSSAVDLAFSAFGEDEALAGWLLSPSASSSSHGSAALEQPRPRTEAAHDTPRLTVIYELVDDAVSAVSAEDFLDSISVSEVSYCGAEDDDERAWALLEGCNGDAAPATVEVGEDDIDPWVVLGHDGS
ncbi:hypothetical protein C8A01DRAFT_20049 [Parachaetomium inaequale]|uniref:Uncharacterized protein n=1 Tax=Parachaetomium inaequale TaxID=2588326 RepID=A0AAN6P9W9_9PEZI|nr:hypothetical protein C8A01DRAFT_20049 [Parachaetomium inaequale]